MLFDVLQKMKTKFALTFLIAAFTLSQAEVVEVFTCDTRTHLIEWGEEGDENRVVDTVTYLHYHRLGEFVGKIDTKEVPLGQLAAQAAAYDSSSDPFFGPGTNYIMRDSKGRNFIVFFEYEEGHRTFTGFRMAINEAKLVDPRLTVYEGVPYLGTSFDKGVLAQLKSLTQKKIAEQAGTGQPATRPESKSEGSDKPQPEAEGRSR